MPTPSLRYLLLLLLILASIAVQQAEAQRTNSYVVVIDPGHGGKDSGAIGFGRKEKDVVLDVALLVKDCIKRAHPEVSVYMTRSTDVFIGLSGRAKYANKKKADLFISIHANSAENHRASGTETYVLGLWRAKDNLNVARRENQAILLEDNYQKTYEGFDPNSTESYIIFEMMQDRHLDASISLAKEVQRSFSRLGRGNRSVQQGGFLVLRETSMPSILVELGFISNKAESDYLGSTRGKQELAQGIADGFSRYYRNYLANTKDDGKAVTKTSTPKDSSSPTTDSQSDKYYRVQIAAVSKKISTKDSRFAKLQDVQVEQQGRLYLYTTAQSETLEEARASQKTLSSRYPGCYIIEYRKGSRHREIF